MTAPVEADKELDEILDRIYIREDDGTWYYDMLTANEKNDILAKTALLAWRDKAVGAARIDEWDYIETLRETSDEAMYESMQRRLTELDGAKDE